MREAATGGADSSTDDGHRTEAQPAQPDAEKGAGRRQAALHQTWTWSQASSFMRAAARLSRHLALVPSACAVAIMPQSMASTASCAHTPHTKHTYAYSRGMRLARIFLRARGEGRPRQDRRGKRGHRG